MDLIRQGDVLLIPVGKAPRGRKVKRDKGRVILAYGEVTGHAHAILDGHVQLITAEDANDLAMWFLLVPDKPASLVHEEHSTLVVPPGVYEVRRQREYAPEEIRLVAD